MKYVNIFDLVFNGSWDCEVLYEKPRDPYLVVIEDASAYAYRGVARVLYKGRVIASEVLHRSTMGIDLASASVGLYDDARLWVMNHLDLVRL